MRMAPVWLYDRWYGIDTRERIRQLALWLPEPVLVYFNCGLPYGIEGELEAEVKLFQQERIIRFWKYENERSYQGSLSGLIAGSPQMIHDTDYQKVIRFVDSKLEETYPELQSFGFKDMEGMMLEQVVLRRRFFSQGLCGTLAANTIAYAHQSLLYGHIDDILSQFFSRINVPSLVLLDTDSFLELRRKSQRILPEIVAEIYMQINAPGTETDLSKASIVQGLISRYESELLSLIKLSQKNTRLAFDAFEDGTRTQIESRLALFHNPISESTAWFSPDEEGNCRLALLLLEWQSGKTALRRASIK